MKYLCFIRHSEKFRETPPPAAMMQAMGTFVEQSMKSGVLVDTGGLLPSSEGARIRLAGGKLTTTDGPFTEAKEVIGGWAILQSDDRAEIMRVSRKFMELHHEFWPAFEGECEVRPMFDPGIGPKCAE